MASATERVDRISSRLFNTPPTPYQIEQGIQKARDDIKEKDRQEMDMIIESMSPEEFAEMIGFEDTDFVIEIFYNHGEPKVSRKMEHIDNFLQGIDVLIEKYGYETVRNIFDLDEHINPNGELNLSKMKRELHKRR